MPNRVPSSKLRRAARLLFYRGGGRPGVKGWVLARVVGAEFPRVVKALNSLIEPLGFQVVAVDNEGNRLSLDKEPRELRRALFLVLMKGPVSVDEAKSSGWRIDDLAMLSASLLYLLSRGGKANRNELFSVLKSKFPYPRLSYVFDRLIRLGYLKEEGDLIVIGWRSKVEIDLNKLLEMDGQA
ncbi:MAG: hypothetical protein DRN49_06070 [Thaumarchaeota archaeon]|nr:MAG: hypothetical protein DRN49_06070 [Nitrososphaerota archaeon]